MMKRLAPLALAMLCLAGSAASASAQVYAGRIDITTVDSTGAILTGVAIEVLGGVSTIVNVTDARGEAHFLNLPPGKYVVTAKKDRFADYRNEDVPVGAGSTVTLNITMNVGLTTSTTVSAGDVVRPSSIARVQTPMVEVKRTSIATNVSVDELQGTPSARDPWVVLQTVPGVIVDRVNVGGSESGQQSIYIAKGAAAGENTWNMDGIALTDMAALGSTRGRGVASLLHGEPTYYDFDMFQELQVTTGGGDVSVQTPGVQLNFVLRSGTNRWRAHGRYYFSGKSTQADNLTHQIAGALQSYNRVNRLTDYGAEIGGPLVSNRVFIWGAYGQTNPRNEIYGYQAAPTLLPVLTADCHNTGDTLLSTIRTYAVTARDCTTLQNYSTKVTAEMNTATRGTFAYFRGEKQKLGRDAGATRPDETSWNQKGPTELYKGELSRTMGSDLFVAVRASHIRNTFAFQPRGLASGLQAFNDDAGVWHNNYATYSTDRPQNSVGIDGNYFKGLHELKFGFGWRKASVTSSSVWPGGGYTLNQGYPNLLAVDVRDWALSGSGTYWSGYIGDKLSRDALTLNVGLRWDRSTGSIGAASVGADPLAPALLPAVSTAAVHNAIVWNSVTPRVNVTYALGADRRTVARASYSMFASQLDSNRAAIIGSSIPYSYAYYLAVDQNGDHVAQPGEYTSLLGTTFTGAAAIGSYSVPKTHEVVVALEHELMRNVGLSAAYTWRRFSDFNWQHYTGITGQNYVLAPASPLAATLPPIGPYSAPFYVLNTALPATQVYESRPGYHQRYSGFEVSVHKRMARNWMARAGFSTNDHREYFSGLGALLDPTPTPEHPNQNGGLVVTQTSGSGKSNVYLVLPKYQFILTSQYQARYGINFGLNYSYRQGYAEPYFRSSTPGSADALEPSGKSVLVINDIGAYRLPNVHSIDIRIGKRVMYNKKTVDFDLDIFNLFNLSTLLGKQFDISKLTFNLPLEIMNPRVIRFGIRIGLQ